MNQICKRVLIIATSADNNFLLFRPGEVAMDTGVDTTSPLEGQMVEKHAFLKGCSLNNQSKHRLSLDKQSIKPNLQIICCHDIDENRCE